MSGIASDIGCPRDASHRFMNFISSDCDLLIRAPSDLRSLFSVCDSISAVISTACPWCMIIPCMNCTSAGEAGGSVARVVGGRVRVGFPGAPGWTTTGVEGAVCCAQTRNENKLARGSAAASTHRHAAALNTTRISQVHLIQIGLTCRKNLNIVGLRLSHLAGTS